MKIENPFARLTKFELLLWLFSVVIIGGVLPFCGKTDILTVIASLVGATALIFLSKGDVLGQFLTVVFGVLYAIISLKFRYYGEMITYLGMTAPIAVLSIIAWLKHPFNGKKHEVKISRLSKNQRIWLVLLTIAVTALFYFILKFFNTANLIFSTVSIATSFSASYLMLFRSPVYALAYAANDIVLITLWILATTENFTYFPMIACFAIFLLNDIYAFYNWQKIRNKQQNNC